MLAICYDDRIEDRYLYNRCHLIGYQLAGENAEPRNLITGTRYLNISSMLPFENAIWGFVTGTGNHVLYRVTPVFEGDNLVASGVVLEACSVEDSGDGIQFFVYLFNIQPGVIIDYRTGDSHADSEYDVPTDESDALLLLIPDQDLESDVPDRSIEPEDIVQKYGNDGSKITFDTDATGLTRMMYSYYPSNYRLGYSAAFYSESYASSHNLQPGFQLMQLGADTVHYDDASQLLQVLHGTEATQVVQAPSYSEAGTPEDMVTAFVNEFNSTSSTALEFVEGFKPSDRESGHYRTEFRLGAYSDAIGMAYRYGEATVDIIARKPSFGDGVIRIYMDGASLEQCEQMIWTASPIMDRTATAEEIQNTVDYVDEYKTANGYYYSNLGLLLLGSDVKGYQLMIKMGND